MWLKPNSRQFWAIIAAITVVFLVATFAPNVMPESIVRVLAIVAAILYLLTIPLVLRTPEAGPMWGRLALVIGGVCLGVPLLFPAVRTGRPWIAWVGLVAMLLGFFGQRLSKRTAA